MPTVKTDTPIVTPLSATVGFNRKVSVRPYESAEASIFMQTEIDLNDSETTMANLKQSMMQCKALVFEELGLEFEVTEGGIVRELLEAKFGNVTEVTSAAPTPAPAACASSSSRLTYQRHCPVRVDDEGHEREGAQQEVGDCPLRHQP